MKCQKNRDNARRTKIKFVLQLGRYKPSASVSCHAPRISSMSAAKIHPHFVVISRKIFIHDLWQ